MPMFNELIASGHGWLFFPMAIALGAMHGLEPGHSKTMMTAFIVAVRGSVWQAFLLGLSATISHTAIIWILAFVGLHYSSSLNVEELEPYFQLATGIVVITLASWMFYRTRQSQNHKHNIDENFNQKVPRDLYNMNPSQQHLKSHLHHHQESDDAHERAHADEMKKYINNQNITTKQIILFGLTGGLMPCPSAFAVLLLCLQLKKVTLGFALVLGFSMGLAITLVTVGVIAAISVKQASLRFKGFGEFARKLPYASSTILILIGLLVAIQGVRGLMN